MRFLVSLLAVAVLAASLLLTISNDPPTVAVASGSPESKVTDPVPLLELATPHEQGLFWTLSQAEAKTAAEVHGMQVQADARVGYLRRQAFEGSTPLYRLRKQGRIAYMLTSSAAERDQLTSGDDPLFRYEGVIGHLSVSPQPGTEVLYRVHKEGAADSWRPALASRLGAMRALGYDQVDGPLGYVYPRWIRAGAIYFGAFDAQGNRAMMDRIGRYYGKEFENDWWGGVRHARDGNPKAVRHWPDEDFSHLKPSIGYYDDSKPETLEQHIKQAAGAGLDHFAFYWYWNPGAANEQYAAGLRAFLAARNRGDMKFTVLPCIHPWRGGAGGTLRMPSEQIDRAAEILVDDYLSQPNILRANDGRPMLQLCDVRGIGKVNDRPENDKSDEIDDAAVRRFTDAIRTRARATLGEEVMITMTTDNGFPGPQHGVDGSYCPGRFTGSYEQYVAGEREWFGTIPGAVVRCATSDFDERPRIGISTQDPVTSSDSPEEAKAKLHAAFRWYEDQSPEGFRRVLGAVRDDIDASARSSAVDNFVLLYAWNEWHEGGVIEPNERDGCRYLDIVRSELRLRNGTGCVAVP
ncbi:glycoside hydrolase family 99-like domain-containing protein [Lentzea chajnantorensis]